MIIVLSLSCSKPQPANQGKATAFEPLITYFSTLGSAVPEINKICVSCENHMLRLCVTEGGEVCCPLCRTVSEGTVGHPLLESMLRQTHEQQTASDCGQCAERGGRATATGTCLDCEIDLCQECIQVRPAVTRGPRLTSHMPGDHRPKRKRKRFQMWQELNLPVPV